MHVEMLLTYLRPPANDQGRRSPGNDSCAFVLRGARHGSVAVKGYSMPAIDHRNVTVPLRVLAGVE
jgi:hypothetical protein